MRKEITRERLVRDIKKLIETSISTSKIYLEKLSNIPEYSSEETVVQVTYAVLSSQTTEIKRAIKRYQKYFPHD